ncbi:hypothetical protein A2U01_0012312 [Trifolium medium]|uniref:Uncharacterized protein n=1 Tax=Trifolium medium TaxID=97028 RepID=A0A392MWL2_9FABA|nr:hypothetical protein [Trifolium medium]
MVIQSNPRWPPLPSVTCAIMGSWAVTSGCSCDRGGWWCGASMAALKIMELTAVIVPALVWFESFKLEF